ncbi:hypothetical protein COHA_007187 [Chlorella ohadii]|uniref:Methyltransferase domain-containing protein n=1 Tax=Chlorella ohadii TaxID=2649997 RepID=A0AAD5H3P2_9CHLO|nr:hypothetical protein COHA_007187 [Chlorella ohadii]
MPGFAQFYDAMVAQLPPEYEAGADVERVCWPLLQELAAAATPAGSSPAGGSTQHDSIAGQAPGSSNSAAQLSVLDMCTGSGRVALALAARWAAWTGASPGTRLSIVGVDHSSEMLAAAQAAAAERSTHSSVQLSWQLGDMAAPQPPVPPGTCSLAILTAGSFHHLLTSADQAAALRSLAACLRQPPAPSFLVLNLLDPGHLAAHAGQELLAGPYRRMCLAAAREAAPDGGMIWRHRFRLQRYASEVAAAAVEAAGLLWEREEGWALREVAPEDLERLAAAAGLQLVRRRARWSDGWGGAAPACAVADGRVFVFAPGPAAA